MAPATAEKDRMKRTSSILIDLSPIRHRNRRLRNFSV